MEGFPSSVSLSDFKPHAISIFDGVFVSCKDGVVPCPWGIIGFGFEKDRVLRVLQWYLWRREWKDVKGAFQAREAFYCRVSYVMATFKSLNLVECQEFKELLLLLRSDLTEGMIPHRMKLNELVVQA